QQPIQYNATASENISLGDLNLQATEEQIQAAAEAAGADEPILRLPQGYATLLGKWFEGGADLSVGEWQRLALARAFLRQARLVILDEPTSAMDPWAEAEWLARLRAVTAGKIVILITHRITTAAQADVIHIMQDGQIIESGSHEALLATDGMYAQSWHTQLQQNP
ncbi:MAG: ATP-binding cassette domain-containing protein, partial [Anaerolineales bacterium]|nr:ATP-binding cassette domain-containing protein [Anaerolineales bacterium]